MTHPTIAVSSLRAINKEMQNALAVGMNEYSSLSYFLQYKGSEAGDELLLTPLRPTMY